MTLISAAKKSFPQHITTVEWLYKFSICLGFFLQVSPLFSKAKTIRNSWLKNKSSVCLKFRFCTLLKDSFQSKILWCSLKMRLSTNAILIFFLTSSPCMLLLREFCWFVHWHCNIIFFIRILLKVLIHRSSHREVQ